MELESSPLPQGWLKSFARDVDLEASFRALDGIEHFHVESTRGYLRSLQMRFEEAWDHFDRASDMVDEMLDEDDESIANLVRMFVLEIHRFNNALLEEPLEAGTPVPGLSIPNIPRAVLDEYPEVRYVFLLRKQCEALLRLHLRENERALHLYEELLADPQHSPEDLGLCFLGKAGCLYNQDPKQDLRPLLEAAGLAAATQEENFYRLMFASRLVAFHRLLEDERGAVEWIAFIERISCPDVTKQLFLQRAERMHRMSVQEGAVLIV